MLKENGKLKTVYVIAGLIVLLLTIGNSTFNWLYANRSDSDNIVLIQENQKIFVKDQVKLTGMIEKCQSKFEAHELVSAKNFELVDKDIMILQGKDLGITKLQSAQTETMNAQTQAITKLTVQTTYMKEAITRLENTK